MWYLRHSVALALSMFAMFAGSLPAAIVATNNVETFNTLISGSLPTTIDFESSAVGTVINNGTGLGGITFQYGAGFQSERLIVTNGSLTNPGTLSTTSGTRFLGTDISGDQLGLGVNNFTINFNSPASAVGLFVIITGTPTPALDSDLRLTSSLGGPMATLNTANPRVPAPANSQAFFLGLVENTGGSLGSVTLSADPFADGYRFRVDDIQFVTAVPEPSASVLGVLALAGFTFSRRKTNR